MSWIFALLLILLRPMAVWHKLQGTLFCLWLIWKTPYFSFFFFFCSLHYINPYQPNEYQRAISAVGSVIEGYDNDRLFPCFGYGGKLPNGTVSHRVSNRKTTPKKALIFWPFLFFFLPFFLGVQFALNGVEANPECVGISGILQAYQGALTVLF